MFICEICGEEFEDEDESDWPQICITCRDDAETDELLALDII